MSTRRSRRNWAASSPPRACMPGLSDGKAVELSRLRHRDGAAAARGAATGQDSGPRIALHRLRAAEEQVARREAHDRPVVSFQTTRVQSGLDIRDVVLEV